jgi:hypothetical protein
MQKALHGRPCECVAFSSQRELFWTEIENWCEVYVTSDLWNMDDVNLAKTLLGQQMDSIDFDTNMLILKIAAECWRV